MVHSNIIWEHFTLILYILERFLAMAMKEKKNRKCNQSYSSNTDLHHSCSRGTGNAKRSLNLRTPRPRRAGSPACWPISPSVEASPQPRPPDACLGFYLEMASECLCGNPSDTAASLFVPY